MGGIDHAHRQPRGHQRKERRNLLLFERKDLVISRKHGSRRGQWILFAQDGVGSRNRRLTHGEPLVHIAKIDQRNDASGVRIDERVVIKRVSVDYAATKMWKARQSLL